MAKILLIGSDGQVGWELTQQANISPHQWVFLNRQALDLRNLLHIPQIIIKHQPDWVINAAAYTAVDRAEQEPQLAFQINCEAPEIIAIACAQLNIPLIHFSTDYVFDGCSATAYEESHPVAPLGIYGQTKWQGEEAVRKYHAQHLLFRISWVFSQHGHNFVKTILRLAQEKEELKIVHDQRGCPTPAKDLSTILLTLIERYEKAKNANFAWGTYHYASQPQLSWYEFATEIISIAKQYTPRIKTTHVYPITTAEYPMPAKRPANSVLSTRKFQDTFHLYPRDWHIALVELIRNYYEHTL